jgi:hypothetical protein
VDIVDEFVRQEGGSALAALEGAGFSADQAAAFMPGAVAALLDAVTRVSPESIMAADLSVQTITLQGFVDVDELAARYKLDRFLGSKGIAALIPRLIGFLQANEGLTALLTLLSPMETPPVLKGGDKRLN